MARPLVQPSFSGGEAAPSMYGRVDLARYGTSLRECVNFIVREQGGVENRAGTKLVAETKDSTRYSRMLRFQFNAEQTFALEFGNLYIRFHQNGSPVTVSGVTAWSGATAYVVGNLASRLGINYYCILAHTNQQPPNATYWYALTGSIYEIPSPYLEAELDFIKYVQSADVITITSPDRGQKLLSRLGTTNWTLTDFSAELGPFEDANSDDRLYIYSTNLAGTVGTDGVDGAITIAASTALFRSSDVGRLVYFGTWPNDTYLESTSWETAKAITVGVVRRYAGNIYEAIDTATTGATPPTHLFGIRRDGDTGVHWRYLHSGFGVAKITTFVSSTVVRAEVQSRLPYASSGGYTTQLNTYTRSGTGSTLTFTTVGITQTNAANYLVTIGGVRQIPYDEYTVNAAADTVTFYTAPVTGTNNIVITEYTNARITTNFALGAWSEYTGYPRALSYFNDRLVMASTDLAPQDIWFSVLGDYTNFGQSSPIVADDAIDVTLATRQVNQIVDIVPLAQLIVLTGGGEFVTKGGQENVLTPTTISFEPKSERGATNAVQAAVTKSNSCLYVSRSGRVVNEIRQNEYDSFIGENMTLVASHLFAGRTIVDIAFQNEPYSVLWCVRDDGVLLGFTYVREQEVFAWHQHNTDGFVESVTTITEGNEDILYLIVKRTINGVTKRFVERMRERSFTNVRDAYFVDCGATYDGRNQSVAITLTGSGFTTADTVTVTAGSSIFAAGDVGDWIVLDYATTPIRLEIISYTSGTVVSARPLKTVPVASRAVPITGWGFGRDTVSGLSHLNGKTVRILADGFVQAPRVVASGSITLDNPAVVAHVGLGYDSRITTLDINNPGVESIRMKRKLVKKVGVLFNQTRNAKVGPSLDRLEEYESRDNEDPAQPPDLIDGLVESYTSSTWEDSGRISVVQDLPLPCSILSVIPEVDLGQ